MGVEKIYKLPDQNAQSAMGVFTNTIGVLFGVTILACWLATQYAAWKLAFQPSLGEPLLAFKSWKLYMPYDFFMWMIKFGHVEGTESAWSGGEWILASLHFLFVPAIWLAARRAKKLSGKTDLHGSAHWATADEIYNTSLLPRPLSLTQKALTKFGLKKSIPSTTGGCYVGAWVDPQTDAYKYLIHNGPEHILAFAPTRSGKGVGLVLPTLLSWQHSTVVHDIKGEAWALSAGFRKAKGQKVLKFEPTESDGSSVRFNPLEEIRVGTMKEVSDCQNIAQMIVDPDGKGMDDHWAKTGHELMSAAILHILYISRLRNLPQIATMRGLVSFFCDPQMTIEQVAESMLNTEHDPSGAQNWRDPMSNRKVKVHPVIAESARSFLNKSENERSGVQSTAMSFLSLYRDPIVAMNTAASEFKVRDLMNHDKPVTLYLVIPPTDQARLRPLIRLMIALILARNTEKMDFADGRSVAGYKHRLLMLLDEFPALGKMEIIETAMAFLAGYGIKCYLITQDTTQLQKAYTRDESIMSNCHVRVAYAPNKFETAEMLSKYLGKATITREQRSYSGSRLSPFLMHQMASQQESGRELLTPDECLRLPGPVKNQEGNKILEPGDMLILVAGASPIYGTQILYFRDPVFDGRSKIRAPKVSDRLIDVTEVVPIEPVPLDPALAAVAAAPLRESGLEDVLGDEVLKQQHALKSEAVQTAATSATSTPAAVAAAVVVTAAAAAAAASQAAEPVVTYTDEELAALDAEADDGETQSSQAAVEAAMLAEDETPIPKAELPDDLDFDL